jgi:hypothetical protein
MKTVYIAGPYGHGNVEENVARAIKAGSQLIKAGYAPFIPHLYHYVHLEYPEESKTWMEIDMAWLTYCDALIRLPDYSDGADEEEEQARTFYHMPVYYSVEEFLQVEDPAYRPDFGVYE